MKKSIFGIKYNEILVIQSFILLCLLIFYISIQYFGRLNDWDSFWVNLSSSIIITVFTGFAVSLFYELKVRKNQTEEIFNYLNINKELSKSGITRFKDFRNIDLNSYFLDAINVKIYFTYGKTFISSKYSVIEEFLKKKGTTFELYLLSEENPFVNSYGNLWSKDNPKYDIDGLKNNIEEVQKDLKELIEKVKGQGKLRAKVKIFKLSYHPVNFSFYQFDDQILFIPTKIIEDKNYTPLTFVCKNIHDSDLFNWCHEQLNYIKKLKEKSLITVINE